MVRSMNANRSHQAGGRLNARAINSRSDPMTVL
jgi:hypothetical protein